MCGFSDDLHMKIGHLNGLTVLFLKWLFKKIVRLKCAPQRMSASEHRVYQCLSFTSVVRSSKKEIQIFAYIQTKENFSRRWLRIDPFRLFSLRLRVVLFAYIFSFIHCIDGQICQKNQYKQLYALHSCVLAQGGTHWIAYWCGSFSTSEPYSDTEKRKGI